MPNRRLSFRTASVMLLSIAACVFSGFALPIVQQFAYGVSEAAAYVKPQGPDKRPIAAKKPEKRIESFSPSSVVFSDDFSTNTSATYTQTGQIGASSWSVNRSAADWGARRNTSPQQLELTNDTSGTTNAKGWAFANVPLTSVSSPFSSKLNTNPGLVTWNFNMRQIQTDPGGFSTDVSYGVGFILATNTTAPDVGSGKTGYAVVLGEGGAVDAVKLVRFSGGLQVSTFPLITSSTTGVGDVGAEYLSVRVTYDPSNNQWQLFLRNDGTTAFADPATGTLVWQGTKTDANYTNTAFSNMGAYWQGSTAATQTAFFDNLSISVDVPVVNNPPVCSPAIVTNEIVGTASYTIDALSNCTTAPDVGETLSVQSISSQPAGAVANIVGNNIVLTPTNPNVEATYVVGYVVSDGNGGTANTTATVNVGTPEISVPGGPLNFGNQTVNTTSTSKNITITNNGDADLVLGTPSFTNGTQGFAFVSDPNGTVVPLGGGQATVAFTFTPTSTGAKSETVTFNSNAPGLPPTVVLTGTGVSPGQFSWSASQYSFTENGGFQNLTIQRTNGSAGTIDVTFDTGEGTANGENDCAAGVDFEMRPGSVQFLDGETSKTVAVRICDDADLEPDETFTATLAMPSGGSIGSPSVTTVTIRDNEPRTRVVDRLDDSVSADECTAAANDCSLRGAVAVAQNGDAITFDTGAMGIEGVGPATITLGGSAILIDKDITITGPGADKLTINGNNASRVLELITAATKITGLTITGGNDSGIYVLAGSSDFEAVHIVGNSGSQGGGIWYEGGGGGPHHISSSTISNNQASGFGGGVYHDGHLFIVHIINSTISGNTAGTGGGIYVDTSGVDLMSTTITLNNATLGSGIFHDGGFGLSTIGNSLIAGNLSSADVWGDFGSLGFNLIGDAGTSFGFGITGDQVGTTVSPIDPKLGPLQNIGGSTPTHGLLGGSPAVDKGSSSIGTDADQTDQRGQARPVDLPGVANASGGDGSDIGAFEIQVITAASASISGRVLTTYGRGVSGVVITVQGTDGVSRTVMTNTLGYYRFDGLRAGETFVVAARSRRYTFAVPVQVVNLGDSIAGLDFRAWL